MTLVDALPAWSDEYRVESPRLLVPLTACFECRLDGASFICDPASALWLTPAQVYRIKRPWSGQRSMLLVVDGLAPVAARRTPLPLAHQLVLRRWVRALRAGRVEWLELEEQLLALVAGLASAPDERAPAPHRAVERARDPARDPARDDTLSTIARAAHCSPFHLARLFRRHTARSLHGYHTQLRMSLALDRLAQGERDLAALAHDLGYASHSHFTAAFRRSFGVAPRAMRTNLTARTLH